MHDGFGTIQDGYYVPHSHEVRLCRCGRLLLLPVGATRLDDALAIAGEHAEDGATLRRCCG